MAQVMSGRDWLSKNDPRKTNKRKGNTHRAKVPEDPDRAKSASSRRIREFKAGTVGVSSVKDFVEEHRNYSGSECVYVPGALKGAPVKMRRFGKNITAARYMCLLTHGAPKYEGALARHKCGNGHLSCINPNHIVWGDASDNASDTVNHRIAGDDVADRILSVKR